MSMMWPPQRVKMVSTPSAFSAFATRWPPEISAGAGSAPFVARALSPAVVPVVVSAIAQLLWSAAGSLLSGAPYPGPLVSPPASFEVSGLFAADCRLHTVWGRHIVTLLAARVQAHPQGFSGSRAHLRGPPPRARTRRTSL